MLLKEADYTFYISAIIMILGIAYDGFCRHNKGDSVKKQLLIIFGIYLVCLYLLGILVWFWVINLKNLNYPESYLLFYLPIVVPLIIEVACFVGHIRKIMERRNCTK